jgi:glutamine synthetase
MNQLNALAPFWDEFHAALDTLGIAADTWIHEVGCSQYEINLLHGDPLQVADQAFLFKYAAKEIALRHGMNAVFMAKPIAGEAGSSMHLHQSVVDAQGHNIFSDEAGQATPALPTTSAAPGLPAGPGAAVRTLRELVSALCQRQPGAHQPAVGRGQPHRRPAGAAERPAARRVENRLAGADANPYLAIAASLAAGLAGMRAQHRPTAALVGDGYQQAHELPQTFMAAHERLASSRHAQELLGPDFIRAYLAVKQLEHDHFQAEITAWERRYLVGQA